MTQLAAIVALAFEAPLTALGPCSCKGFISGGLSPGPRLIGVGMRLGLQALDPISLLTDVFDEGLCVNSGDMMDEVSGGQNGGRKAGKLLWDASEYHLLVVLVGDVDSGSCEFLALVSHTPQEDMDVTSPQAAHVVERDLEVVLRKDALCCELVGDPLPTKGSGRVGSHADNGRVREPLQE